MNSTIQDNLYSELEKYIEVNKPISVVIITDRNTSEYCLPLFTSKFPSLLVYDIIELDPGEENKNIDIVIGIWSMMNDFGVKRNSLIIALGGGVLCDMVAFAASTFKRGVDFALIPTTLLAQTDAAIGGKNGIDFNSYKNMIGLFSEPVCTIFDSDYLKTLPYDEHLNGLAEMLKHGLIIDKEYFQHLIQLDIVDLTNITPLISRSIQIKKDIVKNDPFEKNERKKLNFGHTIAHALESFYLSKNINNLAHGRAVAAGIIIESYLSKSKTGLTETEFKEIETFIRKLFIHVSFKKKDIKPLIEFMKSDKKNESELINFSLLCKIGEAKINQTCSESEINDALLNYIKA